MQNMFNSLKLSMAQWFLTKSYYWLQVRIHFKLAQVCIGGWSLTLNWVRRLSHLCGMPHPLGDLLLNRPCWGELWCSDILNSGRQSLGGGGFTQSSRFKNSSSLGSWNWNNIIVTIYFIQLCPVRLQTCLFNTFKVFPLSDVLFSKNFIYEYLVHPRFLCEVKHEIVCKRLYSSISLVLSDVFQL